MGNWSQNSPKPLGPTDMLEYSSIPYVFCLYNIQCTLLKVVSYYYLTVLSMSVIGFQKKFGWGWFCGVSSI